MSDGETTVTLAITKLSPKPGDMVVITVPPSWSDHAAAEFEASLRYSYAEVLAGVAILVVPEQSKVVCRHRPAPRGSALLLAARPPTDAMN
jgi:hypothetical protein